MKQTLKRRICAAILCHILLLGLAGCGKANKAKSNDGGDPPVKASVDALKQGRPAADSEETVDGAESLARVRGDLEYDGRLTGAAAYLGLREMGDQTELTDWLREDCADLTSELPFLLEIPSERVLGAGYGKLFCIVPRDENTSLAVNHVTWQMMGNGLHPVADEVLYREEYAEPVLVFADPEEPDKEVNLVTNDGVAAIWYPQEDGYGNLILPTDEAGEPATRPVLTTPRAGSRPAMTGGCRPRSWDWPTPRGSATAGCWSCAAAMPAPGTRELLTYTTLPLATSSRTT